MKIFQVGIQSIVLNTGNNTIAEVFSKDLPNTLFGMIILAAAIIILIMLILKSYIPHKISEFKIEEGVNKTPIKAEQSIPNVPINEGTEENLANDPALVAAITAAIMAYMGDQASADGFVVRSIRKSSRNRW